MLNQQPDRQDITLIFVEFGSTLQIRKKTHRERKRIMWRFELYLEEEEENQILS